MLLPRRARYREVDRGISPGAVSVAISNKAFFVSQRLVLAICLYGPPAHL